MIISRLELATYPSDGSVDVVNDEHQEKYSRHHEEVHEETEQGRQRGKRDREATCMRETETVHTSAS
jgi:hypothetical protein